MMKNLRISLIILIAASVFSGCGNNMNNSVIESISAENTVSELFTHTEGQESQALESQALQSETPVSKTVCDTAEAAFYDLSEMNSEIAYSQLYIINSSPEEYDGAEIKLTGSFAVFHNNEADCNEYAVILTDTAGCCSEGLAFVPSDELIYPDDFPADNSIITVTGVIEICYFGGLPYCQLADAIFTVEKGE